METLDDKALRILMAVVRCGSIRGAAEHLSVAPSVVSRQVADTERNIGLPLFDRTSRGVGVTDAGRLVVDHAQRVLEDQSLLLEQISQLRGVQQGCVRVCSGEGFLADLIEHGLKSFAAIYPTIRYFISLGNTGSVVDAVANGDADIGIAYNPVIDNRLRSLAISGRPLCVVAPPGHDLLRRRKIQLSECLGSPYALLNEGHGVRHLVARAAADHGIALTPAMETLSIDALRRFVAAGLGISFLPRFAVSTELERNAVGVVELSDPVLFEASAHLMVKARRRLPTSVDRLANWLAGTMDAFH